MDIHVKRVYNHYEVYVGEEFYCSCDVEELNEILNEIKKKKNKKIYIWILMMYNFINN